MPAATQVAKEWADGFLFVANRQILDLLNTRPVLPQGPTEFLPDVQSLERWFIASGIANSAKVRSRLRSWRQSPEAASFLKDLIAFRERLRDTVLRMEGGSAPSDKFIQEVNAGLLRHSPAMVLRKRRSGIVRELLFDPRRPADLWMPILNGTANLLSEPEIHRLRKCETCAVHFFDTSKKGSRRWCSMNICGNKVKVAAYQRRKRDREDARY